MNLEIKRRSLAAPADVLVVIVNYRCANLTIDCLASLENEALALPGMAVQVVDNASGDGSAERIAIAIRDRGWSSWASSLELEKNGGFAFGNNAAIKSALESDSPPRYVLLLNPDTVVRSGAISALVEFMDRRSDVGIAGSRLEDPDGTPQRSAFRFPSLLGEIENGMRFGLVSRLLARKIVAPLPPHASESCDWVSGASMLVRREVFETIGLLDEAFFMYFEEVDFCRRARLAGWPSWYVIDSHVVHLVGQSSGFADPKSPRQRRPAYWFHARRHYFLKNHGLVLTTIASITWAAAYSTYQVRCVIQRKPDRGPERMLQDFLRHNFLFPMQGR